MSISTVFIVIADITNELLLGSPLRSRHVDFYADLVAGDRLDTDNASILRGRHCLQKCKVLAGL